MDVVKNISSEAFGRVPRVNLERDATLSASYPSLNIDNDRARLNDDHSVGVEEVKVRTGAVFRIASSNLSPLPIDGAVCLCSLLPPEILGGQFFKQRDYVI